MAKRIRFGTFGQTFPPADQSLRSAALAERQGWDFIDFPDQMASTHPDGMIPDSAAPPGDDPAVTGGICSRWYAPFPLMAASAVATNTIELQCAVIDPLRRSPAVFAQEAVTVDHLSGGRASWCIGSGEAKQFEPFGERRTKPAERMREAIRVMHALWDSACRPVSRESEFWPLSDAIFPLPLRDGRKPQILVVGAGESVYELAGELCDGWYTFLPGGGGPDHVREAVTAVRTAAERVGRDPEALRFSALLLVSLAENDEVAWHYARTPQSAWASIWAAGVQSGQVWKQWGYEHPFGDAAAWPKNMKVGSLPPDLAASLPDLTPDEVTDRTIFWGGPERVADRIQPYLDAGLTEICFNSFIPWNDRAYAGQFATHASELITLLGGKPLSLGV